MAPNFKLMGFTMSVAIASKWLLDTEDPGERGSRDVMLLLLLLLLIPCLPLLPPMKTAQAWAIRGAYLLSQVVSYGILVTLYFKAKVRCRRWTRRVS